MSAAVPRSFADRLSGYGARLATPVPLVVEGRLTRMVGPMVDEGLITRMTPPEDRRKTVVAITPTGLALVHAHAGQSAAILGRIESEFGRDRLEQLLDLLEDLQKLDLRGTGVDAGPKAKR